MTNITNTKLLCCQTDSSTTTAAVTTGTITANGDPTASSQTITWETSLGTALTWPAAITWNGGSAPTLAGANDYSLSGQVFNLVTSDGGSTWYGYEEVNNNSWTSSGELYTWGTNTNGVLGQNNTTNDYSVGGSQVGSDSSWTSLSGSFYTALGTKNDGTLWTWGKNENGSQGLNDEVSRSSPTQIGSGTDWKYAADNYGAGGRHNAATKTDGTLSVSYTHLTLPTKRIV